MVKKKKIMKLYTLMMFGENRYPGIKKAQRNRIHIGNNARECTKQERCGSPELSALVTWKY